MELQQDLCKWGLIISDCSSIGTANVWWEISYDSDVLNGASSFHAGHAISNSDCIRNAHNSFRPPNPIIAEENVEGGKEEDVYHFIAYLPIQGFLYELDGLKPGPIQLGPCKEVLPTWQAHLNCGPCDCHRWQHVTPSPQKWKSWHSGYIWRPWDQHCMPPTQQWYGKVCFVLAERNSSSLVLKQDSCVQKDWVSQVQPFIQQRIERYSASEIRFNLLALIRDRREVYREHLAHLLSQKAGLPGDHQYIDAEINEWVTHFFTSLIAWALHMPSLQHSFWPRGKCTSKNFRLL